LVNNNTDVATVSGTTLTIKAAGETNIVANQAGDATWAAAPSVTQKLIIDVVLSVGDDESSDMIASPNPFVNDFNLKVNATSNDAVRIKVFTTTGMMVQVLEGKYQTDIQLGETWPKGMYLLKLESGKKSVVRKVVKH
jgi:hypothetical protein